MEKEPQKPDDNSNSNSNSNNSFVDKFQITGGEDRSTDMSLAVNLADKVRSKVSQYPHPVRTEPPLPHGFVEGGIVGLVTYGLTRPIRSQAMKLLLGSTPNSARIKPMVGMVFTSGQVLISAQVALYSAVLVGSRNWLETLTDFASAPSGNNNNNTDTISQTNLHKSILADDLCQEPIMKALLARSLPVSSFGSSINEGRMQRQSDSMANTNNRPQDVSFMEWIKDPKKVVIDELFRAVASCRSRQDEFHDSTDTNASFENSDIGN